MKFKLIDNEEHKRFEFDFKERSPFIEYIKTKDKIYLTHTEVPKEFQGKGIGKMLVNAVLDEIRKRDLTLIPLCPFVAQFIKDHPTYKELVLKGINIE